MLYLMNWRWLMNLLKILLGCTTLVLSLALVACNKGSHSVDNKARYQKIDPNRTCVPEQEILAGNLVGGQVVKQNDADSKMVVMLNSNRSVCTATPITKRVLLTAAHCIVGSKLNTSVIFHSSLTCESGFDKTQHAKGISKAIIHEKYKNDLDAEKLVADIALVVLEEDIPEGYEVFKIADPRKIERGNEDLFLYGFGVTKSNAKDSGILRKLKLEASLYDIIFSEDRVKLRQIEKGICKGDSGGPSFVKVENELQILGINSYVYGPEDNVCTQEGSQTLADSYRNWIDEKLAEIEKTSF